MSLIRHSLLLYLLSLPAVYAQDQQKIAPHHDNSENPNINLTADIGTYDKSAGVATYKGHVKVTQGLATIWADKLTVYLQNNNAKRIVATGSPVKFNYLGKRQPIDGQGQNLEYNVLKKLVTLKGEAQITQGTDKVRGSTLNYHLDREIIEGSRVKMTFLPVSKPR